MINIYNEQNLIEETAIDIFKSLGYKHKNCFNEQFGQQATLGRETTSEVVLVPRLIEAIRRLNPNLSEGALTQVVQELTKDRSVLSLEAANRDIYKLIKDGILVKEKISNGSFEDRKVRIIDFDNAENNDFFLAQQFWVTGDMYKRRADLIGFVNGLPLIFIELKAINEDLKKAYDDNLTDYKDTIPQLFWYNTFIILSNGSDSRIGSITSEWDHFNEWKKINKEGERGIVSMDTIIKGTCEKKRFLDIFENFILFQDIEGSLIKIVAKNHQYLGVNHTIESFKNIERNKGKLGVFWHTQGSGKSFSMIFFSQKILRKFPGDYTFVIVTDRKELDKQIYKNFASCGAVTEKEIHAKTSSHLRQLLREDHRNIFTLIHKFRTDNGKPHPVLSTRSDIIVITDEAHRTQYDVLAMNMRNALPNAAFIAFTGTPLIVGEELTKKTFGDYISVYNFKQSIDDKATVPLYYENRIPELQITNKNFDEEMYKIIEEADLDENQEKKLELDLGRQYYLITRDDRLEKVTEDITEHFIGRGYHGKAMVVCIDKSTAVKMYDKVQVYFKKEIEKLKKQLNNLEELKGKEELAEINRLKEEIEYLKETDMAVVVSSEQNEIRKFRNLGLEIRKHRERMVKEDLSTKFKDPKDPFRLVFVCAMWMTGFDAPCVSTIYLDKPMRNHTLMQTIARANRVFKEKHNGTIVDYIGVFRNLQKALAIYGPGPDRKVREGDHPVMPKERLLKELETSIKVLIEYLKNKNVDAQEILNASKLEIIRFIDDAVEKILINDDSKKEFLNLEYRVRTLFKAILPDKEATKYNSLYYLFRGLAKKVKQIEGPIDISGVMKDIEKLLDSSIATEGYIVNETQYIDLSQIDFKALKEKFEQNRKFTLAERLKNILNRKIAEMLKYNSTRVDFYDKFQKLIEEYNNGSINIEMFFKQLLEFAKDLEEEEKRTIKEDLLEEELVIFDLLLKKDLTQKERDQVKKSARKLLATLKWKKLVLDWRRKQQTRAAVLLAIQTILDKYLPRVYSEKLLMEKRDLVFQHIFDSYSGANKSIYENI